MNNIDNNGNGVLTGGSATLNIEGLTDGSTILVAYLKPKSQSAKNLIVEVVGSSLKITNFETSDNESTFSYLVIL